MVNWADVVKDAEANGGSTGGGGPIEPFPAGDYELKVVEASQGTTQNGKQKFEIKAQVTNGAHANRLVWDTLTVTTDNPRALGFFFSKMASLGLPKTYFEQGPSNEQIVSALEGRTFRAEIFIDEWQGKKKNKIKNYYPPAQAPQQPQAPQQAYQAPAPTPAPAPAPPAAPQQAQPGYQSVPSQIGQPAAPPAPPQAPPAPAGNSPWGAPPAPPF